MPNLPEALEAARRNGWTVNADGAVVTLRAGTRDLFAAFGVSVILAAWVVFLINVLKNAGPNTASTGQAFGCFVPVLLFLTLGVLFLATAAAMRLLGTIECRLDGESVTVTKGVGFIRRTWTEQYGDVRSLDLHFQKSKGPGYFHIWRLRGRKSHRFTEHLDSGRTKSLVDVIAAATGATITSQDPPT
ncbi:MAG: hypothetical protein QM783_17780 [Phycisphaerales bacterium]